MADIEQLQFRHEGTHIEKNPQLAENLLKAVIEGAAFSLSQTQKPNTLKILQKYLKIGELNAGYGQFIRDDGPTSHHTKRGTPPWAAPSSSARP